MGRFLLWVLLLGPLGVLPGCIVSRPKQQAFANYEDGFRTPEGAFESLRTAFVGEVLDWEYSCFSQGFLSRNSLSRQGYRAYRPEILGRIPYLRWGLSRAVLGEREDVGERTVRFRARIPVPLLSDPELLITMVQEEYYELWLDGDVVAAGYEQPGQPFRLFPPGAPRVVVAPDGASAQAYGLVWLAMDANRPLSQEELERGFTRIRAAREWKLDELELAGGR